MSETAMKLVMWIGGGLLSLLFFFVSFYFYRSIKAYDDLADSVNKLQLTLSGLNGIILSIQDQNNLFQAHCKERHETVNKRLDEHSKQLDEHSLQIAKIETIQNI